MNGNLAADTDYSFEIADISSISNDGDLFDHLTAWLPDDALRRQVLAHNPQQLYGFH